LGPVVSALRYPRFHSIGWRPNSLVYLWIVPHRHSNFNSCPWTYLHTMVHFHKTHPQQPRYAICCKLGFEGTTARTNGTLPYDFTLITGRAISDLHNATLPRHTHFSMGYSINTEVVGPSLWISAGVESANLDGLEQCDIFNITHSN